MKRLILLAMLLLPIGVMAQDVTISSLMAEYSTKSKCSTINLSNTMLRSMGVEMGADELRAVSVANPELMPRFLEQVAVVVSGLLDGKLLSHMYLQYLPSTFHSHLSNRSSYLYPAHQIQYGFSHILFEVLY